ncbi:MAG: hypothetical protein ACT4O1_08120 [Gemmatimonadota bacterium]
MQDGNTKSKLDEFRRKMNELEKAKRDMDRLRQEAIAELLQQRKDINRQLQQLGYEGEAVQERPRASQARADAQESAVPWSAPEARARRRRRAGEIDTQARKCPICDLPGHDLRAHRGQEHKRPFTAEELAEKGLAPDRGEA